MKKATTLAIIATVGNMSVERVNDCAGSTVKRIGAALNGLDEAKQQELLRLVGQFAFEMEMSGWIAGRFGRRGAGAAQS